MTEGQRPCEEKRKPQQAINSNKATHAPLQRISASWYRPMHHLGLCALPMLHCWSFLVCTPNCSHFFCCCSIHQELSLPADIRMCRNILNFKRHLENPSVQTHLVLLCCIKHLCIFGPKVAIQIRYYYYYY